MGSRNFTENIILAHLMADIIEAKTDITVERKFNLGGGNIAFAALKNNEIQLYPTYTGTVVVNLYQEEPEGTSEDAIFEQAKELAAQDGLTLTESFGFNNTYSFGITKEVSEKHGIKTFSDLIDYAPDMVLATDFEFKDREDGLPLVEKSYGINFKDVKGMDRGVIYSSIAEGDVDIVSAYTTDGQLVVNDLVVLENDKVIFPPYFAAPIVRQDMLDQYPEVEDALNLLGNLIDEETMQKLNAQADADGMKAEDVAHDYLVSVGLIEE